MGELKKLIPPSDLGRMDGLVARDVICNKNISLRAHCYAKRLPNSQGFRRIRLGGKEGAA